jgi:hypothetical protein
MVLRTSALLLRARPWLRLEGRTPMAALGGRLPGVSATVLPDEGSPFVLPVAADSRGDGDYVLQVFCPPARLPAQGPVVIHLTFDRSFRAADLGFPRDPRRLVIATPRWMGLSAEELPLVVRSADPPSR